MSDRNSSDIKLGNLNLNLSLRDHQAFLIFALTFIFLISCDDPQPEIITPVLLQTLPDKPRVLAGNRDIVVTADENGFFNLYKQDPGNPDNLRKIHSFDFGHALYTAGWLTSHWATFIIKSDYVSDRVVLVDVTNPNSPSLVADLESGGVPEITMMDPIQMAVASENFLLLVVSRLNMTTYQNETIIFLLDISVPTVPKLKHTGALAEFPTEVLALENGFFIITEGGFAYLDVSDPGNISLTQTHNSDMAGGNGILADNHLFVGSTWIGPSRMGRFDLSNPRVPKLELMKSDFAGGELQFAYDEVSGDYYVQEPNYISTYREANGALELHKTARFNMHPDFHTWNGRFYCYDWGGDLKAYRMPD